MSPMIWAFAAIIAYLAATAALVSALWRSTPLGRRAVIIPAVLACGFHALLFVQSTYSEHVFNLNFYNALSLVALLVVTMTLVTASVRPTENLGVVLFPIALVIVGLQAFLGQGHQVVVDYGWQLQLHVALAVFSFAVLSIGAAQAVLMALQERALRNHQISGPLETLPALGTMEKMLFQLIGLGFALLTLALVSGVVFVDDLMAQHLVHKTVLSVVAWIVFGVLLWGRWQFGWRGTTAIRMTLAGMAVLLLAYFGSKLVLELILERV